MNTIKNTVSLDSKAGDVLTPAGARGIGPGNLAFLEHGSRSVSCITGRLPVHTTMKNLKFQHFSRNNPGLADRPSVSQSAGAAQSQEAQLVTEAPLKRQNLPPVCGGSHGEFTGPLVTAKQKIHSSKN